MSILEYCKHFVRFPTDSNLMIMNVLSKVGIYSIPELSCSKWEFLKKKVKCVPIPEMSCLILNRLVAMASLPPIHNCKSFKQFEIEGTDTRHFKNVNLADLLRGHVMKSCCSL